MAKTVSDVLKDVAAFINQDPSEPTGTDLTMWISLIDNAQIEWSSAYQWKQLRENFRPTTGFSGASVALPTNFKKLMSPLFDMTLTSNNKYNEINPSERYLHDANEKYCWITGNPVTGYTLNINPAISSGASLSTEIQVYPSGLATTVDTVTCPNSKYLVNRTIAAILAARSDPRFPSMAQDADEILSNMIEEEAALSGGQQNTTPNSWSKMGFRIGEV